MELHFPLLIPNCDGTHNKYNEETGDNTGLEEKRIDCTCGCRSIPDIKLYIHLKQDSHNKLMYLSNCYHSVVYWMLWDVS